MAFHLAEAGHPGTPDWFYDALQELTLAISLEQFGEDTTDGVAALRAHYAEQTDGTKGIVAALAGATPGDARPGPRFDLPTVPDEPLALVGAIEFSLPLSDNVHLLDDGWVQVAATARRQGIGTALWGEATRIARAHARTTMLGWTTHLIGSAPAGPMLPPATGSGALPSDHTSTFAQSLGLALEQVERESRLELPVPADRLAALRREAEAVAHPRYRLESWTGAAPERYLDGIAAMQEAISTDAPTGGIDWEGQVWDADRVRRRERTIAESGVPFVTIAVEQGSEEVAGLTVLVARHEHPHRPDQWETVVAHAHRGHRLGMWIKVANLELLARELPGARYVRTWNADENGHMLGINAALGFRPHSLGGAWQIRLDQAS